MKKNAFLLKAPVLINKSKYNLSLQPNEIFKAFSVLITALILTYVSIVQVISSIDKNIFYQVVNLLPLLLSIALLFSVYQKTFRLSRLLVIYFLLALVAGLMLFSSEINYSKVLILPAFVLLFMNNSKREQLWGGVYLCITYAVIQIRYYTFEVKEVNEHILLFELISILFGIAFFIVCNWIKKEFLLYGNEIKKRTMILEQKNRSLEDLVSLNKKQSDKLKKTVLLKEKLISVLSHDIRTPLNSLNLLISNYEKGYMQEKEFILNMIEAKSDLTNMDTMVTDIVKWSKNDTVKKNAGFVTYDMYEEIGQSVLSLYNLSAKNKKLNMILLIDMSKDKSLAISKTEIEVVLRNLLSNAIKFSSIKKDIIIRLSMSHPDNGFAILSVKDFGVGIPGAKIEQLNSDKLVSSEGTMDEVGIGVGLSIVFDIINSNGLKYHIESAINCGTEFNILIPIAVA